MTNITNLTALELAACLRKGERTAAEAMDAYYAAIEASGLNCYITLCKEQAYAQAAEIQRRLDAGGAPSALAGVPIAVKDNICTKGVRTTCASRMLENFIPPYDAAVMEKLRDAGLILLGKTNMDEFAMGGDGASSFFGPAKNPHDPARSPGGSSGGSAAAVAAFEAPLALGGDTGGSIRQPAGHCGVVGLRPTNGAVSRYGAVAYVSSMDQIGPMARTAEDCAALFDIIKGRDERDGTSVEYPATPARDIKELRVGVPREFFEGLDPAIANAVLSIKEKLAAMGAFVEECSLPVLDYAVPAYYVLAAAEASSNLAKFDGIKYGHSPENPPNLAAAYLESRSEGFGREVKRRILLGNFVLGAEQYEAYYVKALQARRLIRQAYDALLRRFDVLLTPVAPTTAPQLGVPAPYSDDRFTCTPSLAGLPAIAFPCKGMPCGADPDSMPIGAQLIGRPFEEGTLLGVAGKLAC